MMRAIASASVILATAVAWGFAIAAVIVTAATVFDNFLTH